MNNSSYKLAQDIEIGDLLHENYIVTKVVVFHACPFILHTDEMDLFIDSTTSILVCVNDIPSVIYDDVKMQYHVSYLDPISERIRHKIVFPNMAPFIQAITNYSPNERMMRVIDIEKLINVQKRHVSIVRYGKRNLRINKVSVSCEPKRFVRFFTKENIASRSKCTPVLTDQGLVFQ